MKWLLFRLAFFYARIYAFFAYYRKRGRRREIEEKFNLFLPRGWDFREKKKTIRSILELRGSRKVMHYLIPLMDGRFIKRFIKVEGLDYLDRALKKGRGVLLMAGHFGNPYLGFNALRVMGYDLILVKGGRPRQFSSGIRQRIRHTDTLDNTIFIFDPASAEDYKGRILETLRSGKIINYYGDTREGRIKENVPFLGKEIGFPTGMIHLACQARAQIIPLFFLYEKGKTLLILKEPIDGDWKEGEKGYREVVLKFAKLLETFLLAFPEQYMGIYGPTVVSDYYRSHKDENVISGEGKNERSRDRLCEVGD